MVKNLVEKETIFFVSLVYNLETIFSIYIRYFFRRLEKVTDNTIIKF